MASHAARTPAPAGPEVVRREQAGRAPEAGTAMPVVLGLVDSALRTRLVGSLQRTVGNGAAGSIATRQRVTVQRDPPAGSASAPPSSYDLAVNPYVVETPGGGAAPGDLAANPYVDEHDPVTLANGRFAGVRALERIATGEGELSSADNGAAVQAVQQALLDLGYSLLAHEHDGRFGGETTRAIGQFRSDRRMGDGGLTARALAELDRSAPPPGEAREHTVDYERLFEDGILDVSIAVGYDEGGAAPGKLEAVRNGLASRGFYAEAAEGDAPPSMYRLRRDFTYPLRNGNRATREVEVRVSVLSPGTGAAARFGRALADSEVAIYTGHARRGIGPDFDEDRSPAENFVIGVNSALHAAGRAVAPSQVEQNHYVIDRVNDLEEMTARGEFDAERYRVWFFNGCTTMAYMDELRGGILPEGMDRGNLDLFGTRRPVLTSAGIDSSFALLDGILASETMEQIVADMQSRLEARAAEGLTGRAAEAARRSERGAYFREGAADNPVVETTP